MVNSLCPYIITVKNLPEDVYRAVGEIIYFSQQWEKETKNLARIAGVPDGKNKPVEEFTLDRLLNGLVSVGKLDKEMSEKIKKVVDIRNNINHKFFLEWDEETPRRTAEELSEYFSECATLIHEVRDYVENMTNEIRGGKFIIKIPNIFEDEA